MPRRLPGRAHEVELEPGPCEGQIRQHDGHREPHPAGEVDRRGAPVERTQHPLQGQVRAYSRVPQQL
jgi:hypothetical protein